MKSSPSAVPILVKIFSISTSNAVPESSVKRRLKNLFPFPALIAGFGLVLVGRVTAQTFTKLHTFTALDTASFTNSDGAYPLAGLILSGNTLYGTARVGGSWEHGTVFAINTDGAG